MMQPDTMNYPADSQQLTFEELLLEISTSFINLPVEEIDGVIEKTQRRVCEHLGLDVSALWQLFAAIGYRFSWGDIRFWYRYLSYDLGDDKIMQDLKLSGPALGVGFRF